MENPIFEGSLTKKGAFFWKKRHFVLNQSTITYFLSKGDAQPRGRMLLNAHSTVTHLPCRPNAFQVVTNNRSLMIFAETLELRAQWTVAIDQVVENIKNGAPDLDSNVELNDKPALKANSKIVDASGTEFELDGKYELIKTIGHGAYGVVISANNTQNGSKVAIKKITNAFEDLSDAKRIVREVRLLRFLNHENIMKIVDLLPPPSFEVFEDIYIVSELMESDLQRVIYSKQKLTLEHIQYFMYQILCGVKYLHSAGVIHRDLKPSNILLNSNCDLKLCDFGLSKGIGCEKEPNTEYVVTRWYRAPEIMLCAHDYSWEVDIWSVGCILAEMLKRKPLFPGNDYIHQLKLITKCVGAPTEQELWYVTNPRARKFMANLQTGTRGNFALKFSGSDSTGVDLLSRMLTFDPAKRINVLESLEHPFVDCMRDEYLEECGQTKIKWDDIETCKLTKSNLQRLLLDDVCFFHPDYRHQLQGSFCQKNWACEGFNKGN